MWMMVVIAFKNKYQFDVSRWSLTFPWRVGNFKAAWEVVSNYILNTTFIGVIGVAGVLTLSLVGGHVFAVLRFRGKKQLFLMIIALLSVPFVLSFIPSYMLFLSLGFHNTRWALIIPNWASGQVFGIFLMRATIAGIPRELYEASKIDGTIVFQDIFHISFPLAKSSMATLMVANFLSVWNWFLWPLVIITDSRKQLISVGLAKLQSRMFADEWAVQFAYWGPEFAAYITATLPLILLFIFIGKYYVEGMIGSGLKL